MVTKAEIKDHGKGSSWPMNVFIGFDGTVSGYRVGQNYSWTTREYLEEYLPRDPILGEVGASLIIRLFREPWANYLYLTQHSVSVIGREKQSIKELEPLLVKALRDVFGDKLEVTVGKV